MKKLIVLIVAILATSTCMAESLSIAGIDVSIGMNKSKIYSDFQDYKIQCLGNSNLPPDCDDWLIVRGKTAPYTALASVVFSDGRVSKVLKYFDSDLIVPEAIRFFEIFHSVLSDMTKGKTKNIKVQTKEERQAGHVQKVIFLVDGKRVLSLRYLEGGEMDNGVFLPSSVSLTEELN